MRKSLASAAAVLAAACIAASPPAHAGTLAASLEAGTVRDPDDFSHPASAYNIANLTQTYDSGFTWSAYGQSMRPANGNDVWAFEGLLGYRHAIAPSLSIYGNIGLGERLSEARDFAYVTLRGGIDKTIAPRWTWNALNLRYRNDIASGITYRASVAGTGFTYRLNDEFALYSRVFATFDTEWRFAGTGLGVGIRRYF